MVQQYATEVTERQGDKVGCDTERCLKHSSVENTEHHIEKDA